MASLHLVRSVRTPPTVPSRRAELERAVSSPRPTLHLARPDLAGLGRARLTAKGSFTYEEVGATAQGVAPPGWHSHQHGAVLGRGQDVFERAREAVRTWRMFDQDWLELDERPEPEAGLPVAFASFVCGLWTVNTCRIVYVDDVRSGDVWRYGFAYGTLQGHPLAGEERFSVTWDRTSDEVRFDVFQFSRPVHPLARLLLPLTRRIQRVFSERAVEAVAKAVTP